VAESTQYLNYTDKVVRIIRDYPGMHGAWDRMRGGERDELRRQLDTLFGPLNEEGRKQLQHTPTTAGSPCTRCRLVYSWKTSSIPCFVEGDTFETWRARQNEAVQTLVDGNEQ
jgi:hypothetical protein